MRNKIIFTKHTMEEGYDDDYTKYLDFLTQEETEEEQFFFDLDFDPKFNPGFYNNKYDNESLESILLEICDNL